MSIRVKLLKLACLFWCIAWLSSLAGCEGDTTPTRSLSRVATQIEPIVEPDESFPRWALVVGNARYPTAPLANPVADADAIGNQLVRLGFNVIRVFDVGTDELGAAFETFIERLSADGGTGLIYFAGHGVQIDGENYLLAVDAPFTGAAQLQGHALKLGTLLGRLKGVGNRRNLVILDACRDNPFVEDGHRARGLHEVRGSIGVVVAFSTGPGEVSYDGPDGTHSPYASALIDYLDDPDQDTAKLFRKVRTAVIDATGERQTPVEFSSDTEELILNPVSNLVLHPERIDTGPPPELPYDHLVGGIWQVTVRSVVEHVENRPLLESVLMVVAMTGITIVLLSLLFSLFAGSEGGNDSDTSDGGDGMDSGSGLDGDEGVEAGLGDGDELDAGDDLDSGDGMDEDGGFDQDEGGSDPVGTRPGSGLTARSATPDGVMDTVKVILLSPRSLGLFMACFGALSLVLIQHFGFAPPGALVIGLGVSLLVLYLLFRLKLLIIRVFGPSKGERVEGPVGRRGSVTQPIPPAGADAGLGRVRVEFSDKYKDYSAKTMADQALSSGTRIRVLAESDGVVTVEPAD